jgi:hypothetical protein
MTAHWSETNGNSAEDLEGQVYGGIYELSLDELEALPVISQGQADDLLIESDTERVWLSRCGMEDGEPWNNKVTVERLIAGRWIEVEWYEAR